ncbi:peptide deformylase [Candidatus Peregrinibacteria bacterium RIFOXYC2_FULL_33_13]|nr:MAG: Peptide deformylase [Candidatus Peregrinibacteria bacterium GW2011_GWA2_33_10]KKP38168.1 MAG: peptide deformylase, peptide deformylase [Candidatus Peregrinibacteria bacterium GW2011_GWC2_33_13]OGJ48983.1 MAG: peptide deformylase [Candidatus Peregrinibacteria bacterium RIFOXYA2_FULL_33_7]OGJ55288.1 MAG: peptide deformylase [Candidatus Peregrinibacteria bacterium RIFOXYC2_FULL_33_13]
MTPKPIITGSDNPILRKKSTKIDKIDATIKKLAKDLIETLKANPGVGLASPQIGINKRMILIKLNSGQKDEKDFIMINPEIKYFSPDTDIQEEGCLSLPEKYFDIKRSKEIIVNFKDLKGNEFALKLQDLNSRVVQHEVDHLDGILIVDRV